MFVPEALGPPVSNFISYNAVVNPSLAWELVPEAVEALMSALIRMTLWLIHLWLVLVVGPCESTGISSGSCQETETRLIRARHAPRQPLQNIRQGGTLTLEDGR